VATLGDHPYLIAAFVRFKLFSSLLAESPKFTETLHYLHNKFTSDCYYLEVVKNLERRRMHMNKLLKIGVPILAAVLVLVIGTGLVLAKEKDTSVLTGPTASYDDDYSGYSQCHGPQYSNCPMGGNCPMVGNYPCAGNGGGWVGCGGSGYCKGPEAGYGPGGWSGDNGANYQPPCHRY